MASSPLPEIARSLLRDHLTSFECLEILMVLRKRLSEHRSALEVSDETGIPADLTLRALAALETSRLIARHGEGSLRFQFNPETAELREAVDALVMAYREQRAAVMSEMSVHAIGRIRSGTLRVFADSFILGKNKGGSDG